MTEPTPRPAWAVTSQSQRTKVMDNNNLVDGYDVYFTTAGGHAGSVFVPMARYTTDNVAAAVAAQAELLDAVGNLTSES